MNNSTLLNFRSQELVSYFMQKGMTIFPTLVKVSLGRRKSKASLRNKLILFCFPTKNDLIVLPSYYHLEYE